MKTILIPTEDHDAMAAVLEAARLLARMFDSYIEGFAVRPSLGSYVTVDPLSGMAISGAYRGDGATQAQTLFESFMQTHGVPRADGEQARYSYGWPRADGADDTYIGSYGRIFDGIALGQPGSAPQNPRMAPLEVALFDSGRPVLMVPSSAPKTLGRNILVAWNNSAEQARTNSYALPLLHKADRVTVLAVEGNLAPGPSAEEAALHLRRNGIKAAALTVKSGKTAPGAVILEQARLLGCDLLIKGAYTQNRIRQIIFGGATRHILENAALPVLMAH